MLVGLTRMQAASAALMVLTTADIRFCAFFTSITSACGYTGGGGGDIYIYGEVRESEQRGRVPWPIGAMPLRISDFQFPFSIP